MAEFLVDIEKELRSSYLAYSLSVIIGRAIPDARDGLKPVHRRILYAQSQMSNTYNRPTKKSARVVGDVIGKYHPHGDTAVYDALVRMAQDFNMRDPLEEGQGNFGSLDGDKAAAMRYTEVRMSKLASEFLNDIEKKTVDFHPNYDGSEQEPEVLPTKVPNLLLNGSSGIAVGMATNIPPHNLGELCDGLLRLIDDPECPVDDLMQSIKGPDFPTAGFVYAGQGLRDAYHTGRGVIKVRGRVEVKEQSKTQHLVIREIPYGVNKGELVKKIAELVNEKKIDGVTDLKDLSDKKGIRIIVALRRGTIPEMVINGLYKYTPLESSFGINMLAVVDNKPQQLNLRTALGCFLDHRREVVIRRTRFDLEKAQFRSHILEGLLKALDIIDEIIELIRSSETPPIAKKGLVDQFGFSEIQAQSILDMRLQRLTGLEREKILDEFNELQKLIVYLTSILEDAEVLRGVLREETQYIKDTYATPRRTEIVYESLDGIEVEDLIPDDDVVITLSRRGYVKRTTLANYQQQKRGGKGIAGLHTSEDDFVQEFLTTTNHQYLLLFTNKGRMYQLKVHQVPEGSRTAKGVHIANLLPMEKEEWVANALTVREFSESSYFLFATKKGVVKRSVASDYSHCRRSGMIALGLKEGDELIAVREVIESDHVVLATSQGMAIRFALSGVRPMGRIASGVKGISLRSDDSVVACVVVRQDDETTKIMTISSLGYGKRTKVDLYRLQSRGGIGLINFKASPKTGPVIGAMPVSDTDSLVLLTSTNKIIRLGVEDIRSIGRATMGVRLVKLDEGATVAGFDKVEESGEENI
ncbi:MAG: DNA gyrase subunit A [Desulfovibrio sp.]